ncbi:MAG: type 4 pilus major pilin [Rhodoferax sp.]|nr:type 4 pilus major pilin [Rhodoferax sp.]
MKHTPVPLASALALSQPLALAPTQAEATAPLKRQSINRKSRRTLRQSGFTAVELLIVVMLIGLLTVVFFPNIRGLLISARTTPTANDLTTALLRIRANAEAANSGTPYDNITAASLANTLADRSTAMTVNGSGSTATVEHKLGVTGSQIAVAPATITTLGDSFTVTFNLVNKAACPNLAAALVGSSEIIAINATTVYRNRTAGVAVGYNGETAGNICTAGNTNTFVFTAR